MKKYNGLLSSVSQQYQIFKGKEEVENDWKIRLVYSICGMMAYASLWDDSEEPISIVHLKKRIHNMFTNYKSLYPELSAGLPYDSKELEEEITDLFLNAGVVYHRPNRIAPSMKHEELCGEVIFQRGIALDSISCVSGIGFYKKQNGPKNPDGIKRMFGLQQNNLQAIWRTTLVTASWKSKPPIEHNVEYLRLKPPYSVKYWLDKPDTTGNVSILRTGMKGSQMYYLYRYNNSNLEVSPLPQWQVEAYNYRILANACLASYDTLPPIEYFMDGALVHIHMNYLLPPRELNFIKLYSWPEKCSSLPCDFRRKLSTEVFIVVKNILSSEGYNFKEGKFDVKRSKFYS